jgi:hypothetical protein
VVVFVSHRLTAAVIWRVPGSVRVATCFANSTVHLGPADHVSPHDHVGVAEEQVRHTGELVEVAANPISPQVGVAAESGDPH